MKIIKKLGNGVKVVESGIFSSIEDAQKLLDMNCYAQVIDADSAYRDRVENNFEYTYMTTIDRNHDYRRFLLRFREEVGCGRKNYERKVSELWDLYHEDKISHEERRKQVNKLEVETCECSKCMFPTPTIDNWKTGKIEIGGRTMKLGKMMRKAGFTQELLDFYSVQIKTEKDVCVTITSAPQYIAGMSYYCKLGAFDGYNGSSCQDVRHEEDDYTLKLGGALNDNKLFIAMMHDKVEDLDDMEGKMVARTLMRYVTIEGKPCLIATQYYGNNETKDMLHNAIGKLHELDIFNNDVLTGERERIEEHGTGQYDIPLCDDVHILETIDEYVDIECPMCKGEKEHEVYSNKLDRYIGIKCPMCGGTGEYETHVYYDIDEWVEVEDKKIVKPYAEEYDHYGHYIEMYVNVKKIREARATKQLVTT